MKDLARPKSGEKRRITPLNREENITQSLAFNQRRGV